MAKKSMMDLLKELVPEEAEPGEMLRAFRRREAMTLAKLQEITGINATNISAIENGKLPMTLHYAETFAAALDVHPAQFLYPSGEFAKDKRLERISELGRQFIKERKREYHVGPTISKKSSTTTTRRKT